MNPGDRRWIVRLWKPYFPFLAGIVCVTMISTAVSVSLPLVLKRTFDGLATTLTEKALVSAVLLYFGLGSLNWFLLTVLIFFRGTMNMTFEAAARLQAYRYLVRHSPGFFQRYRTGDLVTRLTDDVSEKLSWFICSGIFRAIAASALIVFSLVMMIRLDPLLTLFTVGPLPILIVLFMRTGTVLDRRFEQVQARISDLNGGLEACFSGIRVVKAYGRESAEEQSFGRFASACRRAEIDAAKSQTLVDSLFGHVWQFGVVIVLLAGGIAVMNGRLTIGTFVAFDSYVLMLIFPMFDIGTFFVRGRQSSVSIGRLRELEETEAEISESPKARDPRHGVTGRLEFDRVSYVHNGHAGAREHPTLSQVSFEARPGRMVAVVGTVGSGKSTLLRMVPRLTDPARGSIRLDGVDLRELPLSTLRSAVGYVPQEAILFSGTVAENIAFGREGIDQEGIREAARIARLEADLAGFSDGFETRVGVRGVSLSGGQKQRVALARALAGRPRILVLDDVTAALDAETEASLWEELHRLLPDLATIVVTHRTATLERADAILVLEKGRLVEQGRHAELSARGPVYRSIYRHHALEERVGADTPEGAREALPGAHEDSATEDD